MDKHSRLHHFKRYFVAGLFIVVPAWGTFLILSTLFVTLDGLWVDLLGPVMTFEFPGAGIMLLLLVILGAGMLGTRLVGQRFMKRVDELFERIPLVRSIYYTLKGMTDVFQFRERFGQSTVVVFPFPRTGLWAIGFLMGTAPGMLQISEGRFTHHGVCPDGHSPFYRVFGICGSIEDPSRQAASRRGHQIGIFPRGYIDRLGVGLQLPRTSDRFHRPVSGKASTFSILRLWKQLSGEAKGR